ncbi:MAG: hypothetical protein OEV49_14540 [candidate division Zixibacteria bacterium]|nr:hypothetical protein [candidate division Zixibacteria bacterium]MDH3938396.1 hypothetical protein [candidate division Zixibacteria bacterium]MDH4034787.1 hypothetical protein [candidate division Zixibacteria bacterium]
MARLYYKLIAFALGSLGMSCGRSPTTWVEYGPGPEYGPVIEYGVPYATYQLSGQVVKASDQTPLEGIEVSFDEATVTSDIDGNWSLLLNGFNPCGFGGFQTCSLYVIDADGASGGGEFQATQLALQLTQTAPGGTLYYGKFEQHAIAIALDTVSTK